MRDLWLHKNSGKAKNWKEMYKAMKQKYSGLRRWINKIFDNFKSHIQTWHPVHRPPTLTFLQKLFNLR